LGGFPIKGEPPKEKPLFRGSIPKSPHEWGKKSLKKKKGRFTPKEGLFGNSFPRPPIEIPLKPIWGREEGNPS